MVPKCNCIMRQMIEKEGIKKVKEEFSKDLQKLEKKEI
jgi:hypothetical protein